MYSRKKYFYIRYMLYLSPFRTFFVYMHPSAYKRRGQLNPKWGKNLPCTKHKTRSISRTVGKYTSHQPAAACCECKNVLNTGWLLLLPHVIPCFSGLACCWNEERQPHFCLWLHDGTSHFWSMPFCIVLLTVASELWGLLQGFFY